MLPCFVRRYFFGIARLSFAEAAHKILLQDRRFASLTNSSVSEKISAREDVMTCTQEVSSQPPVSSTGFALDTWSAEKVVDPEYTVQACL